MANLKTLRPNIFSSENQPKVRPSRKGIPNRQTVLSQLLEMNTEVYEPEYFAKKLKVTLNDAVALGIIIAAIRGNATAFRYAQDALWGKITERREITGADGGPLMKEPKTIIVEVITQTDERSKVAKFDFDSTKV